MDGEYTPGPTRRWTGRLALEKIESEFSYPDRDVPNLVLIVYSVHLFGRKYGRTKFGSYLAYLEYGNYSINPKGEGWSGKCTSVSDAIRKVSKLDLREEKKELCNKALSYQNAKCVYKIVKTGEHVYYEPFASVFGFLDPLEAMCGYRSGRPVLPGDYVIIDPENKASTISIYPWSNGYNIKLRGWPCPRWDAADIREVI